MNMHVLRCRYDIGYWYKFYSMSDIIGPISFLMDDTDSPPCAVWRSVFIDARMNKPIRCPRIWSGRNRRVAEGSDDDQFFFFFSFFKSEIFKNLVLQPKLLEEYPSTNSDLIYMLWVCEFYLYRILVTLSLSVKYKVQKLCKGVPCS